VESSRSKLAEIFNKREQEIAAGWLERQAAGTRRMSPAEQHELTRQFARFPERNKDRDSTGLNGKYLRP
jgi:hypothetical protein